MSSKTIKKIAILTSGGDSPGMNKVIESIVSRSLDFNLVPYLIFNGFKGLVDNEFKKAKIDEILEKSNLSGSMIYCSRFNDFSKSENISKAISNLKMNQIDCLFVLGGNGSMQGANLLVNKGIKVIAIPCTIDNDVSYTDYSIGFDSALNVIADTIDLLKNTARSHRNIFLIELMGRNCSALTIATAYINNVDYVITPFNILDKLEILKVCKKIIKNKKREIIFLITERLYSSSELSSIADYIQQNTNISTKVHVMGFIQRGAKPTGYERYTATKMGYFAIESYLKNKYNIMISMKGKELTYYPLDKEFYKNEDKDEISYLLSTINRYKID